VTKRPRACPKRVPPKPEEDFLSKRLQHNAGCREIRLQKRRFLPPLLEANFPRCQALPRSWLSSESLHSVRLSPNITGRPAESTIRELIFQKVGSRGPKNDPPLETAVIKMIMAPPAFVFGAMSTRTFKKSLFSSSRCRLSPAETPLSQTSDSILLFQLASSLRPLVACSIACLRTNRLPLSWASTEAAFSLASLDLSLQPRPPC